MVSLKKADPTSTRRTKRSKQGADVSTLRQATAAWVTWPHSTISTSSSRIHHSIFSCSVLATPDIASPFPTLKPPTQYSPPIALDECGLSENRAEATARRVTLAVASIFQWLSGLWSSTQE